MLLDQETGYTKLYKLKGKELNMNKLLTKELTIKYYGNNFFSLNRMDVLLGMGLLIEVEELIKQSQVVQTVLLQLH